MRLNAGCGRRGHVLAVLAGLALSAGACAQDVDLELLVPGPGGSELSVEHATIAPLPADLAGFVAEAGAEWRLVPGDGLRNALERWSTQAGYTLIWESPKDYPIEAQVSFPVGTQYRDAVRSVMRAVWARNPGIKATLYANRVVVVSDIGGVR